MDRKKKIAHEMNKLVTLVLILVLIAATSIVFNADITGKIVGSGLGISYSIPPITEVNNFKELKSLNEGFYLVKEGFVSYMESSDSYIPLYIQVNDVEQQNGLLSIDSDGNMEFDSDYRFKGLPAIEQEKQEENLVSVDVAGIKGISGFVTSTPKKSPIKPEDKAKFNEIYKKYPQIPRGTFEGLYSAETTLGKNMQHNSPSDIAAGTTGPLGLSKYKYENEKYNPKSQYDPNTLEGSLEIAARSVEDMMKNPKYDSSASEAVRANQIMVAWNRGDNKMPSSSQVERVLNTPNYAGAYAFIYADSNLKPAEAIGRFVNFMYGYLVGKTEGSENPSSPSNTQQQDETQFEVSQKQDTQGNTIFYYSDYSTMTVNKDGDVLIIYANGKEYFFKSGTSTTSKPPETTQQPTSTQTPTSQDPLSSDGDYFYVGDDGKIWRQYSVWPDSPVVYKDGKFLIDGGYLSITKPLTINQINALQKSAPEQMQKLQMQPSFKQSDGTTYYPQDKDILWRKEGDNYFKYDVKKDSNGYTFLVGDNGNVVTFTNPNDLELTNPATQGFTVLTKKADKSDVYYLSQLAIEKNLDVPPQYRGNQVLGPPSSQGAQNVAQSKEPSLLGLRDIDDISSLSSLSTTFFVDNEGKVYPVNEKGEISSTPRGVFVNNDDLTHYSNSYIEVKINKNDNSKQITITDNLPPITVSEKPTRSGEAIPEPTTNTQPNTLPSTPATTTKASELEYSISSGQGKFVLEGKTLSVGDTIYDSKGKTYKVENGKSGQLLRAEDGSYSPEVIGQQFTFVKPTPTPPTPPTISSSTPQPTKDQLTTIALLDLEQGTFTKTTYADGTIGYKQGDRNYYVYKDGKYGINEDFGPTVTIYNPDGSVNAISQPAPSTPTPTRIEFVKASPDDNFGRLSEGDKMYGVVITRREVDNSGNVILYAVENDIEYEIARGKFNEKIGPQRDAEVRQAVLSTLTADQLSNLEYDPEARNFKLSGKVLEPGDVIRDIYGDPYFLVRDSDSGQIYIKDPHGNPVSTYLVGEQFALVSPTAPGTTLPTIPSPKSLLPISQEFTNKYSNALKSKIKEISGNPNEWAIDENGNIVCKETVCNIDTYEGGIQPIYNKGDVLLGLPEQKEERLTYLQQKETEQSKQNVATFIASIEQTLTEFQGLGYVASLFMDQDVLLAWRDRVDRIFATFYLGTEYITSSICGVYLDGQEEGIAYAETPQGLAQVAAHIEATKTEPIFVGGETQFIYKITFTVRNGDFEKDLRAPEEMKVNVVLKGQSTVNVFRKDQVIKRGSTLSRAGRNAIVQESPNSFNKVCLKFDQIPLRWKIHNNEICNKIQASSGQPTSVSTQTSGTGGSGSQSSNEINDF